MASVSSTYTHRQKAPLWLILSGAALWLFIAAWLGRSQPAVMIALIVGGVLMILAAMCFHHLTVEDQGESLAIRFGPLPLFHRRVRYSDIERVEPGRTLLLDGWGIHLSIRGGWVWNLWGRDCVVVHLHKGTLRIGTDDAPQLVQFLEEKIGQR